MHETSLARQLLEAALDAARAQNARRVLAVNGWVAETESLAPEALQLHFAAHARGTIAEHARLVLEVTHVAAECGGCGERYLPEHHLLLCPACGGVSGRLLGQTGAGVRTIEIE